MNVPYQRQRVKTAISRPGKINLLVVRANDTVDGIGDFGWAPGFYGVTPSAQFLFVPDRMHKRHEEPVVVPERSAGVAIDRKRFTVKTALDGCRCCFLGHRPVIAGVPRVVLFLMTLPAHC